MHLGIGCGHQISTLFRRRFLFKREGYLTHGLITSLSGATDTQGARSLLHLPSLCPKGLGKRRNFTPIGHAHDRKHHPARGWMSKRT